MEVEACSLACGFHGQPGGEGACGSWFSVRQAVRVGRVGSQSRVLGTHVCKCACECERVLCLHWCAWEYTCAEPKFEQKD